MSIPKNHKAALFHFSETDRVRFFQEGWGNGLVVDGIYGPKTAEALDDYIESMDPDQPDVPDPPCAPTGTMEAVFYSAKQDEGEHEVPMGSNNGPYVEARRKEVNLPRLAGGEWCGVFQSCHLFRNGIPVKSRGAPGVVRGIIALPNGVEIDVADIGVGFYGMALRKRGKNTHHVQVFRTYMTPNGPRVEHVGGNEKHAVRVVDDQTFEDFFDGVIQVAAIA